MNDAPKHISLCRLHQLVKQHITEAFVQPQWIVAEISELNPNRSGHCYLELIEKSEDNDQIVAKARATIWAFTFKMLKPYFESSTGQTLTRGLKVMVRVTVEFHEVFGMSLNITDIDPTYTLGDMARRRREIIQMLQDQGIAGMNKELVLNAVPQRIAIISSPSAAGYEDFVKQMRSHTPQYKTYLKLFPAVMQGNEAEQSIIAALDQIFEYDDFFDAVAIIRGGGSTTDLICFDSYNLAANVAQFPLPVLTGIGHERDESVVDMVAHTRLKTPTAVAAFILSSIDNYHNYLMQLQEQTIAQATSFIDSHHHHLDTIPLILKSSIARNIFNHHNYLSSALLRLKNDTRASITRQKQAISKLSDRSKYASMHYLSEKKQETRNLTERLITAQKQFFRNHKRKIELLEKTSVLLDPFEILKKGYTITSLNGDRITHRHQLSKGDTITTHFTDGTVKSIVE